MVFCNDKDLKVLKKGVVTILILIDGFLQFKVASSAGKFTSVTILILIDGFLQSRELNNYGACVKSQSLF